jgi:hypothetical protein
MVCFTSPNRSWFNYIVKDMYHVALYMPLWNLDELFLANFKLHLGLDFETIEERFHLFGGCARYCLAIFDQYYTNAETALTQKARSITSFDAVQRCIEGKIGVDELSHQIVHFVPAKAMSDRPHIFTLQFASDKMARLVDESISDASDSKRNELVHWLGGVSKCSSLVGWLFEGYTHRILDLARTYQIRCLSDDVLMDLALTAHEYVSAPTSNYESIDGHYFEKDKKTLYLFQITRSNYHPVKQHGLVEHLKKMNLADRLHEIAIKLVFVVPKRLADFKLQKIKPVDYSKDLSVKVVKIPGIKAYQKATLATKKISSVLELKEAVEANLPGMERFGPLLERFMKGIDSQSQWNFLLSIPQFVLTLDVDY